jgi:hypothetical protein
MDLSRLLQAPHQRHAQRILRTGAVQPRSAVAIAWEELSSVYSHSREGDKDDAAAGGNGLLKSTFGE